MVGAWDQRGIMRKRNMKVVSTKTQRKGAMLDVFVATNAHIDHMKIKSKTRGEARIWAMAGAFSVMASGSKADQARAFFADPGAGEDFGQGVVAGWGEFFAKVDGQLAGLRGGEASEIAVRNEASRTQQGGIQTR